MSPAPGPGPGAAPNLLVLLADQFRGDLLGANGSTGCRTPSLDALAAGGVGFSRAYTVTPLCTPARAALFTGRFPHSNGLTANTQYPDTPTPFLRAGERLLFEHLAAAGYRCGYAGKWHLNAGDEEAEARRRGVADFRSRAECTGNERERRRLAPRDDVGHARDRTMAGHHPPLSGVAPYPEPYHPDAAVAGETVALLRQYRAAGLGGAGRPFALVCSLTGPHFPIEVPEPFASRYEPASVPRPRSFDDDFAGKPPGQRTHPWLQLGAHLSWPEWQRVIAHYWAYASYIDSLMGRVLGALDEAGLAAGTAVLATADHGEMAGCHRMFDKGPYLYEDVMRVPHVWRWPGRIPPRSGADETLVSHVDVVPTLLALAGVRPLPDAPPFQGASLAAHLTGAAPLHRPAVFAETSAGDRVNPQLDTRAVITRTHKLVFRPGDVDELYDLVSDPEELRNLAAIDATPHAVPGDVSHSGRRAVGPAVGPAARQQNPLERRLGGVLSRWMRETHDPLPQRPPELPASPDTTDATDAMEETL